MTGLPSMNLSVKSDEPDLWLPARVWEFQYVCKIYPAGLGSEADRVYWIIWPGVSLANLESLTTGSGVGEEANAYFDSLSLVYLGGFRSRSRPTANRIIAHGAALLKSCQAKYRPRTNRRTPHIRARARVFKYLKMPPLAYIGANASFPCNASA